MRIHFELDCTEGESCPPTIVHAEAEGHLDVNVFPGCTCRPLHALREDAWEEAGDRLDRHLRGLRDAAADRRIHAYMEGD